MKQVVFYLAIGLLGLGACDQQRGGLDRSGRGDPARLSYAEQGTGIRLVNTANGKTSETIITAGQSSGLRGAYTGANGQTGGFYPGCWGCGGQMQIEEDKYGALWPLETGKQVTFLRTAPDGQQARVVIRVAGLDEIETEAGRFEAYMLDGRIEHITGPRYSAQVRAWWAPGPGWVVKAEGGDSQGSTLSSEVAEFILP